MKRILVFLFSFSLAFSAYAKVPAQLEKDFSQISGYVVMPMSEGEYLIDLDAQKGVHLGDIFTISHPGKKIVHPVSGEIIGTLEGSIAYLQVTRLKSGYSYAHQIGGDATIKKGDSILRFNAVPTLFQGTSEEVQILRAELQTKLSQLDWISSQNKATPLLTFTVGTNSLRITDPRKQLLFSYPLSDNRTSRPTNRGNSSPRPQTTSTLAPAIISAQEPPPQKEAGIIVKQTNSGAIWHGETHNSEAVALCIEDLDKDGTQETATLLRNKLIISRYTARQASRIATLVLHNITPLTLDCMDLNANGYPELFISATRDGVPVSRVYELKNNNLTLVASDVPMLFRRIDTLDNGSLLLGQKRSDLEVPFSVKPFKVVWTGNKYAEGSAFPLPASATIFGLAPLPSEKKSKLYAYLSDTDYLKVKSVTGQNLYESPEHYGGSENTFQLKSVTSDELKATYYLPQRLILTNDEILVAQNEGSRIAQNWRQYTKSRVVSLKWNGLSLDEIWRTSDQNGQTADISFADIDNDGQKELVLAVKFKHKSLFSSPKSALVIYEFL